MANYQTKEANFKIEALQMGRKNALYLGVGAQVYVRQGRNSKAIGHAAKLEANVLYRVVNAASCSVKYYLSLNADGSISEISVKEGDVLSKKLITEMEAARQNVVEANGAEGSRLRAEMEQLAQAATPMHDQVHAAELQATEAARKAANGPAEFEQAMEVVRANAVERRNAAKASSPQRWEMEQKILAAKADLAIEREAAFQRALEL